YVERIADPAEARARLARGDVAVADPRLLAAADANAPPAKRRAPQRSPEALCFQRPDDLLDRLGEQRLPGPPATAPAQPERAVRPAAMDRYGGLGEAAGALGIHRTTLARRLEALGLRKRAHRGNAAGRRT